MCLKTGASRSSRINLKQLLNFTVLFKFSRKIRGVDMYFSYGIFEDNRVPNFWGEFDSCLKVYCSFSPCTLQRKI